MGRGDWPFPTTLTGIGQRRIRDDEDTAEFARDQVAAGYKSWETRRRNMRANPVIDAVRAIDPEAADMLAACANLGPAINHDWGTDSWSRRKVDPFADGQLARLRAWSDLSDLTPDDAEYLPEQIRNDVQLLIRKNPEVAQLLGFPMDDAEQLDALRHAAARRISGEDWGQSVTRKAERLADGRPWWEAHADSDQHLNTAPGAYAYNPVKDIAAAQVLIDATRAGVHEAPEVWRGETSPFNGQVGDIITRPLASATREPHVAERFRTVGVEGTEHAAVQQVPGALYRIENARGVDATQLGLGVRGEAEFLIGGSFRVTAIGDDGVVTLAHVEEP